MYSTYFSPQRDGLYIVGKCAVNVFVCLFVCVCVCVCVYILRVLTKSFNSKVHCWIKAIKLTLHIDYTVEPRNNGQVGTGGFVRYSEVSFFGRLPVGLSHACMTEFSESNMHAHMTRIDNTILIQVSYLTVTESSCYNYRSSIKRLGYRLGIFYTAPWLTCMMWSSRYGSHSCRDLYWSRYKTTPFVRYRRLILL